MSFLLDADVLSNSSKKRPNAGVANWLENTPPEHMFVSVLTIGEIHRGATKVRARGDVRQARYIEGWMAEMIAAFNERIVPVTLEVAEEWGGQQLQRPETAIDDLLAATAAARRLTVVTRNTKDFEHTGVRLLNPFSD